jgi:CubicO group peptidase (beta-lactamase class C family)
MLWHARLRTAGKQLVLVLLFLLGSSFTADAQSWSPNKELQIDRLVDRFRASHGDGDATLPTLSISIGVDGKVAMAKGYGESDGMRVTEHTRYEIGSLTKQFTAAAVLEMIKAGVTVGHSQTKITTQTPLTAIFGDNNYWTAQPWLTVGRLLTMTSNLPNFTRRPPDDTNPWEPIAADQLFKDIETLPPSSPSDEFDYSNTNYFLLAEMMELALTPGDAAPLSYHAFLRKRIFLPSGMADTGFIDDKQFDPVADAAAEAASLPISTAVEGRGAILASPDYRERRRPPFAHADWLKGSADMVSSAADLFAWNKALMNAVVPADVRDQMFSDAARVTPFVYYCMGWFCEHKDDRDIFSHSGAVPGYTSYNEIVRLKTGGRWISVTLLSNCDQLDGLDELAGQIAEIVLE